MSTRRGEGEGGDGAGGAGGIDAYARSRHSTTSATFAKEDKVIIKVGAVMAIAVIAAVLVACFIRRHRARRRHRYQLEEVELGGFRAGTGDSLRTFIMHSSGAESSSPASGDSRSWSGGICPHSNSRFLKKEYALFLVDVEVHQ